MALYGVGLDTTIRRLNTDFKLAISQKGGSNVRNLRRIFKSMDTNGNHKLEMKEFQAGLANFGFFPKIVDLQALVNYYDQDKDGCVNFEEFMSGLREPLNLRRHNIINKVFDGFVRDNSRKDYIYLEDLANAYNVSHNLEYIQGKKNKEQLLLEFSCNFDVNSENMISRDEFIRYNEDISLAVPSDEAFMLLVKNVWGVIEDEENEVNKESIKSIVKTIRQRLIQKTVGNHDEYILRKIFNDFDINKNGNLSLEELYAMMIKLEIPIQKKFLAPIFKKFDKNGNGIIEFEEFVNYLINNPYP